MTGPGHDAEEWVAPSRTRVSYIKDKHPPVFQWDGKQVNNDRDGAKFYKYKWKAKQSYFIDDTHDYCFGQTIQVRASIATCEEMDSLIKALQKRRSTMKEGITLSHYRKGIRDA